MTIGNNLLQQTGTSTVVTGVAELWLVLPALSRLWRRRCCCAENSTGAQCQRAMNSRCDADSRRNRRAATPLQGGAPTPPTTASTPVVGRRARRTKTTMLRRPQGRQLQCQWRRARVGMMKTESPRAPRWSFRDVEAASPRGGAQNESAAEAKARLGRATPRQPRPSLTLHVHVRVGRHPLQGVPSQR